MRKSVLLPKGTLVLTNSATIGVPIVLGVDGCCIHDGYLAFPNFPHDLLSQKFVLYLFHSLKKHAERSARGLAQLNLNTDLVRSFPFGLPPLAEQKRIVAKVDELMGLCDRLEAQQTEREQKHAALSRASLSRFAESPTPANLEFLFHNAYSIDPADLRKSILTLAVHGKLLPKSYPWKLRLLKSLATKIGSGATPHGGRESYVDKGIPLIRSMNVHFAGFVPHGLVYLTDKQAAELANVTVQARDVLLNITGASIGRCTIAPPEMAGARVNQHVMIIRPSSEIESRFLSLFLASPQVQWMINDIEVGATRQALTKGMIERFEIPLPPLAEQRRIVAKVDQLMALVDQLEAQLAASRATAEKLLEAVVAELTTQKRGRR
jgi:type I restriction enzyme S subunit